MAWTAGVTKTTGDLITAAIWNSYLGASGSLDYLKDTQDTNYDHMRSINSTSPSRSLDTIYQCSADYALAICITCTYVNGEKLKCLTGSGSPPTGHQAYFDWESTDNDSIVATCTFFVPPSYYYEAETTGTPNLNYWREIQLCVKP